MPNQNRNSSCSLAYVHFKNCAYCSTEQTDTPARSSRTAVAVGVAVAAIVLLIIAAIAGYFVIRRVKGHAPPGGQLNLEDKQKETPDCGCENIVDTTTGALYPQNTPKII